MPSILPAFFYAVTGTFAGQEVQAGTNRGMAWEGKEELFPLIPL